MLLAVNIGNTNINVGLFQGSKILRRYSIPTVAGKNKAVVKLFRNIFSKYSFDNTVICSVVPEQAKILSNVLKRLSSKQPMVVGKNINVPIKNRYRIPTQLGQDRLVNAYAVSKLYAAPLIVVDFGTTVTFDAVSRKKEYLGGMILPGLRVSLKSLAKHTALLPDLKLKRPREFIGRSTQDCMLSGAFYGLAALTESLIKKIKDKIGEKALVIGTGGDIELISKYCRVFDKIDRDLTLKGLNLLNKKGDE